MSKSKTSRNNAVLKLLGALHFGKALVLLSAGFGVLKLLSPEGTEAFGEWLGDLPFVGESQPVQHAIAVVGNLPDRRVQEIAIAAFAYAALFVVEGTGLWMGEAWAEILTIVATSSLIPFEVYEVTRKLTVVRSLALTANVVIVIYLIVRRRQESKESSRRVR